MNWRGILVLGVAISALAVGIGSAGAKTMLDANNYAGTAANCPPGAAPRYATLQAAINNIAPGGTVNVCKGTFTGPFTVPASKTGITITGVTRLSLTVGCSATTAPSATFDSILQAGGTILTILADNVTVRNLVIRNSGANGLSAGTAGNTITQNLFLNNSTGAFLAGPSATGDSVSANCFRSNTSIGVFSNGGLTNSTIQSNTFRTNNVGAELSGQAGALTGVSFSSNFMFSNTYDLLLLEASSSNAIGNISTSPGTGFLLDCATSGSVTGNIVNKATVNGFIFYGALCPSTNMQIQGNVSQGQTAGDAFSLQPNSIRDSTFTGNIGKTAGTNGLLVNETGPAGTRVRNNSFAGNIFQGSTWGCRVTFGPANLQNWNGNSNIGKPMNTPGTCFP
jgi:nitrous oxidase accessory protein NosD